MLDETLGQVAVGINQVATHQIDTLLKLLAFADDLARQPLQTLLSLLASALCVVLGE